jgi:hypothetical protein
MPSVVGNPIISKASTTLLSALIPFIPFAFCASAANSEPDFTAIYAAEREWETRASAADLAALKRPLKQQLCGLQQQLKPLKPLKQQLCGLQQQLLRHAEAAVAADRLSAHQLVIEILAHAQKGVFARLIKY